MHSSVVTYIPRNFSNINPLCGNFFCNFPWPMKPVMHWPFVSVIWNHTVISIKAGIESPAITLTQFILWKQKMLSVLANLWKSRPKLFTWDTLMLCYSIQPSNKGGCNDASGNTRHTREGSADHFTRLVVLKDESNPGEPLCCWEGKFLWGIRTSRWLSVCISFTRAVLSCITGITWSESRPHVLGPPCQASAPGLITGPAGTAPYSQICYNHLRSSDLSWGRSECPSAGQTGPMNTARPDSFWLKYTLSNLLKTRFNINVRQGGILQAMKRYRGSVATFFKSYRLVFH